MGLTAATSVEDGVAANAARQSLIGDGYCILKNIADRSLLDELTVVTGGLLDGVCEKDKDLFRYQGSNIFVAYQHPVFARLFALPAALDALTALGFPRPKWLSAYLLSKPAFGPPLYWHQDWAAWDAPDSAAIAPPQLFLMYYLTDTCRENGCLRVIPGTHRKRIALHGQLPIAHSDASYKAPLESPGFCRHPDEIEVPMRAGDLVVGDARVLHAAHPNRTAQRRTCLTLWYAPDFENLSEPVQAWMARKEPIAPPNWWEGEAGAAVEPLIPRYTGNAQPSKWTRAPGAYLL